MRNERKGSVIEWPGAIRAYREAHGFTVLRFARLHEVSPQAVYMWESGANQAPYRVTQAVLNWIAEGRPDA